jgi:hypothetical protein
MKITSVVLEPQDAVDIVIGAIEGGTGYWAECTDYKWKRWYVNPDAKFDDPDHDKLRDIPRDEVLVRIKEDEDNGEPTRENNDWFEITTENLERAVCAVLNSKYAHTISFADYGEGIDVDATGADIIFQYAMFGELVFA